MHCTLHCMLQYYRARRAHATHLICAKDRMATLSTQGPHDQCSSGTLFALLSSLWLQQYIAAWKKEVFYPMTNPRVAIFEVLTVHQLLFGNKYVTYENSCLLNWPLFGGFHYLEGHYWCSLLYYFVYKLLGKQVLLRSHFLDCEVDIISLEKEISSVLYSPCSNYIIGC